MIFITDFLNGQSEPFDGFLGFSQGNYQIQATYKAQQYFGKKLFSLKHRLPYFYIDFSGPKLRHLNHSYKNRRGREFFVSSEIFVPGVESLHFRSQRDISYSLIKGY